MTATRKGVRKKAARKSAGLRVTGLTGTEAAIRAMSQAKPQFNPVPDDVMTEIMADITGGKSANRSLIDRGVVSAQFYRTLDASEAWAGKYARAKSAGIEVLADGLLEIQDEEPPLRCPGGESPGDAKADAAWVSWQRNRVDTRKWLLSKLAPRKYGDKVEQIHSGGETPVGLAHSVARPQLDAILALAEAMKSADTK